jgi:hypothetical protein
MGWVGCGVPPPPSPPSPSPYLSRRASGVGNYCLSSLSFSLMLSALPAYPHQVPFADEVPYISRCGVGGVIAVLAGPCWLLLSCPIGCVLQLQQSSQLISLAASLFPSAQTSRLDCLPPSFLLAFFLLACLRNYYS